MNSMGVRHNTRATPLLSLLWPPHVSAQSICDQAVIKLPRTTYEPVSGCASEMPPHKADSASQRAPVGDSDALLFRRIIASLKSELYVVSGHIVYPACIKLYGSQPLSSSFAALPSTPDSIFSPICASTNSDYKAPTCLFLLLPLYCYDVPHFNKYVHFGRPFSPLLYRGAPTATESNEGNLEADTAQT